jgi:hypothetical protein
MNNPITVLLIDDQSIITEAVQQMLASETGVTFHYCSDPTQAIRADKECHPTVILRRINQVLWQLAINFGTNPRTTQPPRRLSDPLFRSRDRQRSDRSDFGL